MIDCLICEKKYPVLTPSHLRQHGETTKSYKARFKVKNLHSPESRKKRSAWMIGNKHAIGHKTTKAFSNGIKKRWRDPKWRKKTQAAMRGSHSLRRVR